LQQLQVRVLEPFLELGHFRQALRESRFGTAATDDSPEIVADQEQRAEVEIVIVPQLVADPDLSTSARPCRRRSCSPRMPPSSLISSKAVVRAATRWRSLMIRSSLLRGPRWTKRG
jgi:hypothetical protein